MQLLLVKWSSLEHLFMFLENDGDGIVCPFVAFLSTTWLFQWEMLVLLMLSLQCSRCVHGNICGNNRKGKQVHFVLSKMVCHFFGTAYLHSCLPPPHLVRAAHCQTCAVWWIFMGTRPCSNMACTFLYIGYAQRVTTVAFKYLACLVHDKELRSILPLFLSVDKWHFLGRWDWIPCETLSAFILCAQTHMPTRTLLVGFHWCKSSHSADFTQFKWSCK